LNFQVTEIESRIYVKPEEIKKYGSININYDINLRNPTVESHKTPFGETPVLRVEYAFTINYLNPSIGHIRFTGNSDYYNNKKDLEEIRKKWNEGKPPVEVQNEIANTTVTNLAPIALTLSRVLGLPPSLPIPTINFQQPQPTRKNEPTSYHA